jgi:hypothetical protein
MGKKLGSNNAPSFFCCLMFQFEGRVKVHCQSLASSFPHFSFTIFVVTHFWVPTNKKKYNNNNNNNNKKKKKNLNSVVLTLFLYPPRSMPLEPNLDSSTQWPTSRRETRSHAQQQKPHPLAL